MALPIETLEAFFEGQFLFEGRLGRLTRFDGYAYWHLLWGHEDGQFLKVAVDREQVLSAFPVVEIEGRFSDDLTMSPLNGGAGVALVLRPAGADQSGRYVTITKTENGRFSLSTTVGSLEA